MPGRRAAHDPRQAGGECTAEELELKGRILRRLSRRCANKPFQPHAVARTRHIAYQYSVVMKYLDNLIAWGDQPVPAGHDREPSTRRRRSTSWRRTSSARGRSGCPPRHSARRSTFTRAPGGRGSTRSATRWSSWRASSRSTWRRRSTGGADQRRGRRRCSASAATLYFCIPRNEKLLGYWDTVADRLFKIRNCMNIEGVVRQLRAVRPADRPRHAGQGGGRRARHRRASSPASTSRCRRCAPRLLIRRRSKLAGEVRTLGGAAAAGDREGRQRGTATLLRQQHEVGVQDSRPGRAVPAVEGGRGRHGGAAAKPSRGVRPLPPLQRCSAGPRSRSNALGEPHAAAPADHRGELRRRLPRRWWAHSTGDVVTEV